MSLAHILIVDDERDVVTLLRFLLEKDDHRVSEAFDGAQALAFLGVDPRASKPRSELPDAVILDVMMPVMDGYTVSRRMSEYTPTKDIPLIILTAKGQMRDLFAMNPGVAAYMEKPFDPRKLRDVVAGVLGKAA